MLGGCRKAEPLDPRLEADGYYLGGTLALQDGNPAKALEAFAEVRKRNPSDPRLSAAEGEAYLAARNVPLAIASFEEASKRDPKRATPWSRLGYLYLLRGEREKSRDAVDRALRLNPKDWNALETRADLEVQAGQLDAAIQTLVRASELAPFEEAPDFLLEAAQLLDTQGKSAEALGLLRRAGCIAGGSGPSPALEARRVDDESKEGPARGTVRPDGRTNSRLCVELADRLARAEEWPAAASAYEEAARLNPADPTLWELAAAVRTRLEEFEAAEKAYRASLSARPRALPHIGLARLRLLANDRTGADAELVLALGAATGEEVRESLELAELMGMLGKEREALGLLKVVAAEPEQEANNALQLQVARLGKSLKDLEAMTTACARVAAHRDGGTKVRCP
jgi:tetratricopeptide (TPR) repeat protein